MRCNKYQLYWQGRFSEKEFDDHLRSCDECRQAFTLDGLIQRQAQKLPAPESAPWLWAKIEDRLTRERGKSQPFLFARIFSEIITPKRHLPYKIAALLIIALGLSYLLIIGPQRAVPEPRNLLTSSALARVEEIEMEYERAIAELEQLALPLVANADTDLLLLYRDRLETIDEQIVRCKEALEQNRANAHIRRYLLAAYQDKKETLSELLGLTKG